MAVLGYLPKIKRCPGTAFGAYFLHDFSIKVFLIQYSINWPSFDVIPFSFSKYQTSVIKLLFRQLVMSQTLKFMFNHILKQLLTGKKGGQDKNIKIWISGVQGF